MFPSQEQVPTKTAKSKLFEFFQKYGYAPQFEIVRQTMPPADPCFTCVVKLPALENVDFDLVFEGNGRSKRLAEHAAAEEALKVLKEKGYQPDDLNSRPVARGAPGSKGMPGSHSHFRVPPRYMQPGKTSMPPADEGRLAQRLEEVDSLDEQALRDQLKTALRENAMLHQQLQQGEELRVKVVNLLMTGALSPAPVPVAPTTPAPAPTRASSS